jgi:subtilase family serine protease
MKKTSQGRTRALFSGVEFLESRTFLSVVPIPHFVDASSGSAAHHAGHHNHHVKGRAHPNISLIAVENGNGNGDDSADAHGVTAFASTGPAGYSPQQIRAAYGIDQITYANGTGTIVGDGTGQTIAIVDAYDAPTIANDLAVFDQQFGLPGQDAGGVASFFTKVSQNGNTRNLPKANGGWAQETSLDVEWAHAVAPGAKIVLVEASSNSFSNLLAAVDYAHKIGDVVSMSWGSNEFSGETSSSYDGHFLSGSRSVTFIASAGDSGGVRSWPAVSSNVLSVGGSSLYLNTDNTYSHEDSWSSSGGGTSAYESKPGYQAALGYSKRSTPDVGYNANPYTGVAVYDSYRYNGASGWMVFGGTSAGAPQWAGLIAIANQGRTTRLDGPSQVLPAIYSLSPTDGTYLHDVTTGQSSSTTKAAVGYDQVNGQGTPVASQLVTYLHGVS